MKIIYATEVIERMRGLIYVPAQNKPILILPNCRIVHTAFMQYNLDVYFFDVNRQLLSECLNLPPWRISPYIKKTQWLVEIPTGMLTVTEIQQLLTGLSKLQC